MTARLLVLVFLLACSDSSTDSETRSSQEPRPTEVVEDQSTNGPATQELPLREGAPPLANPFVVAPHSHGEVGEVGCLTNLSGGSLSVTVTLDPDRNCPESGAEIDLLNFDLGRVPPQTPPIAVELPEPGSEFHETLNLATYRRGRRVDPLEAWEIERPVQFSIEVLVRVLAHDRPYLVVHVSPKPGALPRGIREFGGDIAIFVPPNGHAYLDETTWHLD